MKRIKFLLTGLAAGVLAATCSAREAAYVESARTGALSTGVMMTPDTKLVLDYAFVSENSRNQWPMGCQGALGVVFAGGLLNRLCWILGDDQTEGPTSSVVVDTARHTAVYDAPNHRVSFITGVYTNFTTEVTTAITKNGTVPLALFARGGNAAGTSFDNYANARIYSFETISNGVTTHLFVPCANGFKDVLADAVKTCATTGTLTYVEGYGSADDYQLTEGVLSCRVTAFALPGGTVAMGAPAVGDGAPTLPEGPGSTAVSNWVEKGQAVALVATAADGFAFSHWEGETTMIDAGLATDASVTVRAARALQLQAVFLPVGTTGANSTHYVKKGLVAQYDGIENAGVGVHDASSRNWVDLSGNGNNGSLGSAVAWGTDGWTNNQNGKPVDTGTAFGPLLASRLFTLEFSCRPSRKTTREAFLGQYSGANTGYNIEHNSSKAYKGQVRLWFAGNPDADTDVVVDANDDVSLALAVAPRAQRLYRNGVQAYARDEALSHSVDASYKLIIGGENNRDSMAFRGTYHAFRLYDRVLTPEEIQYNNALDAVRFRGVSPSTVTLPGSYSFDANGTPCFRVVATAFGRGAISADEGAACAAVTNDVPVNGACTVTLTSVPAEGSVFAGWSGDVGTIVRGCATDATIVVTATESTRLVAAFTPETQPALTTSSGLYVTNGLVLWFDGIENAGVGVHDATTRTWKDLSGHNLDGALNNNVSWTDQGWRNAAQGRPVQVTDTTVARTVATKNYTVEFTCRPSRKSSRESFFSLYTGSGLSIEHNSSGSQKGQIRLYLDNKPNYESTVIQDANETATTALTIGEYGQEIYKNGTLGYSGTTRMTGTFPTTSPLVVGGEPSRDTQAFYGDYYACRVYDRKLSAGEVAANAFADRVRYQGLVGTCWTNAAGGAWNDGDSWSADVPNVRMFTAACLNVPDYAIAVREQVPAVTNFSIANGAGTACVDVSNGGMLEVKAGKMDIGDGGRIQVGDGGTFVYDGNGVVNGDNESAVTVNAGGTLAVAGGSAEIRNYTGKMVVQGTSSKTGVVSVTSGSLRYAPGRDRDYLQIKTGGRLEMTGGTFTSEIANHVTTYNTYLMGGTLDLTGTAVCSFIGSDFRAQGGRIHLGGDAKLRCSTKPATGDLIMRFLLSSGVAGGYTELTVDGNAAVELDGAQTMAYLANDTAGERAIMNWNSTGSFTAAHTLAVGFRKGYGELNVTKGLVQGGGYGLRIGQGSGGVYGGDCPTGVVNVAGGRLQVFSAWNDAVQFNGLIVGAGNYSDLNNPGFYRGTLNVSAGAVTNGTSNSYFGVGIGLAEGDVNQTGGEIVHMGTTYQTVLGAWGGTARWTTAGGRTLLKSDVYVGGILTNQLAFKSANHYQHCPVTRHNATASLAVSNGSFTVEKKLLAGEDGTASITLGENGVLAAASASLKNTTLTYSFGTAGTGALNVTGALEIGSNVSLVVDATAFEAPNGTFPILTCGSRTGDFASATVQNGHGMAIVKTATGYVARKVSGTLILVQ